jgi:DNA mismatch repair protein MutS
LSIFSAGLITLHERKSTFLFATHFHEIAKWDEIHELECLQMKHMSVHYDREHDCLVYDRKFKDGAGNRMYGLEVCRGLDMDAEFLDTAVALRKAMFTADGKAHASRYNPAVIVSRCALCGASGAALETHHIKPQAAADADNRIAAGKHKNTKENLAVLCGDCHDKHHNGMFEITGWVDTSQGLMLAVKACA